MEVDPYENISSKMTFPSSVLKAKSFEFVDKVEAFFLTIAFHGERRTDVIDFHMLNLPTAAGRI
jgi:hypothetical protein